MRLPILAAAIAALTMTSAFADKEINPVRDDSDIVTPLQMSQPVVNNNTTTVNNTHERVVERTRIVRVSAPTRRPRDGKDGRDGHDGRDGRDGQTIVVQQQPALPVQPTKEGTVENSGSWLPWVIIAAIAISAIWALAQGGRRPAAPAAAAPAAAPVPIAPVVAGALAGLINVNGAQLRANQSDRKVSACVTMNPDGSGTASYYCGGKKFPKPATPAAPAAPAPGTPAAPAAPATPAAPRAPRGGGGGGHTP